MDTQRFVKNPMLLWRCFTVVLALLALAVTPVLAKSVPKTVKVPATMSWNNTRIQISAGQAIKIQASGKASTLKTVKSSQSGPAGQKIICGSVKSAPPPCALTGAKYGALVGKIGNNPAFVIGKKLNFTAKHSGTLYLSVNDNLGWYHDNSGGYTAVVTTP